MSPVRLLQLWKIAKGFHKPLSLFVDGAIVDSDDATVLRQDASTFAPAAHDLNAKVLFPFDPRFGFEMFLITLAPQQIHESEAHEQGIFEHVLVIEGCLDMQLNGNRKTLATGDVLRFAADQAHAYRNTRATQPVVFHNLIYYLPR